MRSFGQPTSLPSDWCSLVCSTPWASLTGDYECSGDGRAIRAPLQARAPSAEVKLLFIALMTLRVLCGKNAAHERDTAGLVSIVIALLQRVTRAWVDVEDTRIAEIGRGLMVLIGVERGDAGAQADRLLERVLGYRVFADQQGRMNLSVTDIGGGLLLVPQFTLAADTRKGRRPSFTSAAEPAAGAEWFEYIAAQAAKRYSEVKTGRFGADMQVGLVNDGPVTFWLQVPPGR